MRGPFGIEREEAVVAAAGAQFGKRGGKNAETFDHQRVACVRQVSPKQLVKFKVQNGQKFKLAAAGFHGFEKALMEPLVALRIGRPYRLSDLPKNSSSCAVRVV